MSRSGHGPSEHPGLRCSGRAGRSNARDGRLPDPVRLPPLKTCSHRRGLRRPSACADRVQNRTHWSELRVNLLKSSINSAELCCVRDAGSPVRTRVGAMTSTQVTERPPVSYTHLTLPTNREV